MHIVFKWDCKDRHYFFTLQIFCRLSSKIHKNIVKRNDTGIGDGIFWNQNNVLVQCPVTEHSGSQSQCLLLYYAIMLGYIVFCSVVLPWMYARCTAQQIGGSLQFNEAQQVTKQYIPYKTYCFAIN